jgi:phosphate transport system permease protein
MSSPSGAGSAPRTIDVVRASLKRRYAAERRFRLFGLAAVLLGLAFVAMLFISIISKGWTAFTQTTIALSVDFDAQVIDPDGTLVASDLTEAERRRRLVRVNFLKLARDGLRSQFPDVSGRSQRRALDALLSPGAPLLLRERVTADPAVIGTEQTMRLLADDDVDMLMKGHSSDVRTSAGVGSASLTGTSGEVRILSTGNAFAEALADVKERLDHRAIGLEREATRLQRELDRLPKVRDTAVTAAGAAPVGQVDGNDGDSGTVALSPQQVEAQQRLAVLERQIASRLAEAAALRRRAQTPGGEEPLTRAMPSWLVSINGGMLRLTRVGNSEATAEVITPPRTTDDAAAGTWELVQLTLPAADRRLSDEQIAWVWQLDRRGLIEQRFNVGFFINGSSREPELAGIAGALMGSFYTLALTLLFSFPVAVGAAVYLEEFAPKNRWTDLIEVNINNLAAVPSIVFGLLGLAVFINIFGVPRSTPLVAALVLTLMTLPTIIASRAALKSVPPSIREAALGVGASPLQTQLHHVLPLALPGMLTGTIIGMAQALGETAPLLMIGMVAFIVDIPSGITDPSTVLPVQIFLWADSPERGFVERTSAAIMVLLGFLILMNLAAVLLRRRFERRW